MRRTIVAALLLVVSGAGCRRPVAGVPVADTYDKVGRPEVWRVPAQCQAARLGMLPGDVVLAYAGDPVHSYEEMLAAEAAAGGGPVEVAVLRGEQELTLEGVSGPLGFVPNSVRYSGSLALALEAILASFGRPVDYGWLAALTSESFTLSGRAGECESWWPGGKDGTYLEEIGELMGLTLDRAFVNGGADTLARRQATVAAGLPAIRNGLGRGRALLVRGEWGESPVAFWGVASRLDDPDSAVLGYSIGSATEQRLTGDVMEVFVARPKSVPDPQPEDLLVMALDHALELGLAVADSGWRTGLDAYDGLIASLDTTSFCAGDPQQGQARFRRFLWAMVGCKAGAGRFVEEMKEALPEQAELIDEIAGAGRIIVSKLEGIIQSGVGVESADDRRRIQIVLNEIQLIENDLLGFYEELIGEL